MSKQNPRRGEPARAEQSIAADKLNPTGIRPLIQANQAMRARLNLLLWGFWYRRAA